MYRATPGEKATYTEGEETEYVTRIRPRCGKADTQTTQLLWLCTRKMEIDAAKSNLNQFYVQTKRYDLVQVGIVFKKCSEIKIQNVLLSEVNLQI